jgi:heparanase
VHLNNVELALGANDELPRVTGEKVTKGVASFAATTITFLVFPDAGNAACR